MHSAALFVFVFVFSSYVLNKAHLKKVRRSDDRAPTFADELARVSNFPSSSPVEAYFGAGAHTHSFPLSVVSGPSPLVNNMKIGDNFPIENDIQFTQTGFNHSHEIGGVNGLGESTGMDWNKQMTDYRTQLTDAYASQGQSPHPYYLQPTSFFGRNPFEQDVGVSGSAFQTATAGQHNIGGLKIGHSFQPSYPFYSYNQNLPGVNPFGKGVNWTDHFEAVLPHHASYVANSPTVQQNAVPLVGSSARDPTNQRPNPFTSAVGQVQPVPPAPVAGASP